MAEDSGTRRRKGKPAGAQRRRGFVRAGGLIEAQMRTRLRAKRGFVQARLRALWPEIAGPEFAAICAPLRLARARGPAGGLLTVAVERAARAAAADAAAAAARAGERRPRARDGRAHPADPGRARLRRAAGAVRCEGAARRRRPTSGEVAGDAFKHW